jgi:hypothetical protein
MSVASGIAGAQVPSGDSVVGSGVAIDPLAATGQPGSCCEYRFSVSARSGPGGEGATGSVEVSFGGRDMPPSEYSGHVVCLAVSGTRALFDIVVDSTSEFGPPVGQTVTLFAVDNRGPVSQLPRPVPADADRFREVFSTSGCVAVPTDPLLYSLLYYVIDGDIAVEDAPVLPSAKEQCQNGGWRAFPGFKNQGDCVSYVATGGRNQPHSPPA